MSNVHDFLRWIRDARRIVHNFRKTNIIQHEQIRQLLDYFQKNVFEHFDTLQEEAVTDSVFDQMYSWPEAAKEATELQKVLQRIAKGKH